MSAPAAGSSVTVTIDGHDVIVPAGRNLLQAILEAGVDLPYFCWHPALGAVGACRQCAVTKYQNDEDATGRVDMACMTPCTDGLRIDTADDASGAMRRAVIEFLMTNHPHDCPVCEEGGECHLQDMTVMTGHAYRRFHGLKRTHHNQDLGPFVGHEMNRCIACYRCVRFYRDYAGGDDLEVFGAHHHVYFGRATDGTLESPFSGNLAEVCPTGVFTDRTFSEHYTRKWDLQSAPSICAHCSVGCNTLPGERYGRLRRVVNRYHGGINGYFLCDRGRFGYGHTNAEDRPTAAYRNCAEVGADEAVSELAQWVADDDTAFVGSPRACLESNVALGLLAGSQRVYRGIGAPEARTADAAMAFLRAGDHIASARDLEACDAVVILGEDLTHTAPRLALSVRQSVRNRARAMARRAKIPEWQDAAVRTLAQDERSPLIIATPGPTDLDGIASHCQRGTTEQLAHWTGQLAAAASSSGEGTPSARGIVQQLAQANRVAVVAGTSLGDPALLDQARLFVETLRAAGRRVSTVGVFDEANSVGEALIGGPTLDDLFAAIESGRIKRLVVLENDLYRRAPRARVDAALDSLDALAVIDSAETATARRASWLLPAGTVFESGGTFVNHEGRAQRFFQVHPAAGDVAESWRWLQRLGKVAGRDIGATLGDLTKATADAYPALASIVDAAPSAEFLTAGGAVPRQSHRYSGRTAMHANRTMHEPRPPADADAPLAFSMEGAAPTTPKPAATMPIFWAPRWNSVQSLSKFQDEVGGALRGGDPGVRLLDGGPETVGAERGANSEMREQPADSSSGNAGELRWIPRHAIFGSDELSARAPVIVERAGGWTVTLHPADAAALNLVDGGRVRLRVDGESVELGVRVEAQWPRERVGVPVGCPDMPYCAPGTPVGLEPSEASP